LARAAKRPIRFLRDRHASLRGEFLDLVDRWVRHCCRDIEPLRDPSLLDVEDRLGRALALLPAANGRFTL